MSLKERNFKQCSPFIVADLIEDGFECSSPWFFGLVACRGERIVGYALCNRAYSSWTRRAFYLEDLFVLPEERRNGVATIMIQELCKVGQGHYRRTRALARDSLQWFDLTLRWR